MPLKNILICVILSIVLTAASVKADDIDGVISEVPISDVRGEIRGIGQEIQGHVFPENVAVSHPIVNLIGRGPVSSLISTKTRTLLRSSGSISAVVDIVGDAQRYPNIRGHITLHQIKNGPVVLSGSIRGLPRSGFFAMHFHEHPTPYKGTCETVGEHFNPANTLHGGQNSFQRHAGDMGNIIAQGRPGYGVASVAKSDFLVSLDPNAINSIIGRSLVIHMNPDDLGKGPNRESKKNGNSGTKIACGNVVFGTR